MLQCYQGNGTWGTGWNGANKNHANATNSKVPYIHIRFIVTKFTNLIDTKSVL